MGRVQLVLVFEHVAAEALGFGGGRRWLVGLVPMLCSVFLLKLQLLQGLFLLDDVGQGVCYQGTSCVTSIGHGLCCMGAYMVLTHAPSTHKHCRSAKLLSCSRVVCTASSVISDCIYMSRSAAPAKASPGAVRRHSHLHTVPTHGRWLHVRKEQHQALRILV